jgi:hypothetical protein
MKLNADFSQRALVHAAAIEWVASPMAGVHRRMLDRIGDEVARATTIVRYAPGSAFSPHVHDGGEEFLVLEGVFEDEHGGYPTGSYVRNPPTSSHTPGSGPGCVILVKLQQFDLADRVAVNIDTNKVTPKPAGPGVQVIPLFKNTFEDVRLEIWAADTDIQITASGGLEVLVLNGGFEEAGETLIKDSWLRLPDGDTLSARTGEKGARVWIKSGHLAAR